jgi:hypothetical protein
MKDAKKGFIPWNKGKKIKKTENSSCLPNNNVL